MAPIVETTAAISLANAERAAVSSIIPTRRCVTATADDAATTRSQSLTWAALALAGASVLVMVVLAAMDHDGPAWLLQPALGLAAAVTAWRAGGTSPRGNVLAFAALIVGGAMVLVFLGWLVSEA